MFDLFYLFDNWITEFYTNYPIPTKIETIIEEGITTEIVVNDYLLSLTTNTTILIYLLWTILILLTIWFVLGFVKAIYYYVLEITK